MSFSAMETSANFNLNIDPHQLAQYYDPSPTPEMAKSHCHGDKGYQILNYKVLEKRTIMVTHLLNAKMVAYFYCLQFF